MVELRGSRNRNNFTSTQRPKIHTIEKEAHTLTTPLSLYSDADELNRSSNNLNMTSSVLNIGKWRWQLLAKAKASLSLASVDPNPS